MRRFSLAGLSASRHTVPVLILVALAALYWRDVLFTSQVLLPGAMLRGFAPFGGDPQAPWNLLQWDALGQYFPWRTFAARELQSGHIPLWNPYQFSGAPFIANGQSAVFYPLNIVFWIFDVARAFGLSAFLHTLLASIGTYALLQNWKLTRAASLLGAVAFGFCGYLASWVMLPTLANTASWLPLALLCLERSLPEKGINPRPLVALVAVLACAMLAGHAQIFFYILVALTLRMLFLPGKGRAILALCTAFVGCGVMAALQILPTLELARNGHRAGGGPTMEGWNFLVPRALQIGDLPSLLIPGWPHLSFSENFGYIGFGTFLLAASAVLFLFLNSKLKTQNSKLASSHFLFAITLTFFGLLYATATPLAQAFYFTVPGLSQMGGVGRALILWSLGGALMAALGLSALQHRLSGVRVLPLIALALVTAELFGNGMIAYQTAPREVVYPATEVTTFLKERSKPDARVLFITPRGGWLPTEVLQGNGRNHPPGVLPPNGAMVYGIHDVSGYDSLASRAYREFVAQGEGGDVSPPLNGNMILLENPVSASLDALQVRYVVSQQSLEAPNLKVVLRVDDCVVYERTVAETPRREGREFSPGWREGKYQPESFRFGAFLSLLALGVAAGVLVGARHRN